MNDTGHNQSSRDDCPIAIVGAGFAGLGMGIELQKHGIDSFTIYEAADEVGGTWRDNTYPGCACDIPAHLYSFSFELNPDWSRSYSPQPEIQRYLEGVADKYAMYSHIEFGTEIVSARFDRETAHWTLRSRDGRSIEARALILAVGGLSRPKIPNFEGLEAFDGESFHSARWNHDYDLAGKRVGVVGTGASAIQIVPQVAKEAKQVCVFQRTAPWVTPRPERSFSRLEKTLFKRVPGLQRLYRSFVYWLHEMRAVGFVSEQRIMKLFEMYARRFIRESFDDPVMREKVTPDYTIGCKRILLSNDYYPALAEPHVDLVASGVERFEPNGVITADGDFHELDAMVFATGFHVTDFLSHFDVVGLDGRELNQAWQDGAEAYYGVAVSGFPNLFMLVGPNTGLGHNSIVFMIEAQARLIRQGVETIIERDLAFIDVRPSAHRGFNDELQRRMSKTIWSSGCRSWYLEKDGKNTTLWPGYTAEYWLKTRRLNLDDFRMSWAHEAGPEVNGQERTPEAAPARRQKA